VRRTNNFFFPAFFTKMGSKNFADPASACKLRLLLLKEWFFEFGQGLLTEPCSPGWQRPGLFFLSGLLL
jgi:hypothetical protein